MKNFIQQRKQLRISTTEQPTSLLITETKIGGIIAKIERSTETTRQGSLSKNVSVSLMPPKKKKKRKKKEKEKSLPNSLCQKNW